MRHPRLSTPLLLIAGLLPVAALGQGGGRYDTVPLAVDFKNAPPGTWAEYTVAMGEAGAATMKTRWAFLGRDPAGNTLELTMTGRAAPLSRLGEKMVTRMLLVPDPVGNSKPFRQIVMQLGDRDPVEVPLDLPGLPGQKFQNPDPKKLVGKETIKVAGGAFPTSHFREVWEDCTVDAWISEKVPPLGVVRTVVTPAPGAVGPGGKPMPVVTMELLAHGKDARPAITRTPRPLDPGATGRK